MKDVRKAKNADVIPASFVLKCSSDPREAKPKNRGLRMEAVEEMHTGSRTRAVALKAMKQQPTSSQHTTLPVCVNWFCFFSN